MSLDEELHTELIEEMDYAWLRLTKTQFKLARAKDILKPLEKDKDKIGLTPLRVMKDPNYISYTAKTLLNMDILPIQAVILSELWRRPFPMLIGSRGLSKSFCLALYAVLKMALTPMSKIGGPGCQIVVTGAGFRQAKQVFEYMERIYYNAKRLKSINTNVERAIMRENDRYTIKVGSNTAIAIPMGTGDKVRGLRANIVVADEFGAIDPNIFETVIQGFATVSHNPVDSYKIQAKKAKAHQLGLNLDIIEPDSNQIIISGTAGYDFEHFASYWKKYKKIVESKGDENKLAEVYEDGIPEDFDWRDYSVIRIPYTLIPKGFLDDKIIMRAKATTHSGTFNNEFGACFSKDSAGFFKRSLIESAVANDKHVKSANWPSFCPAAFDAKLFGQADKEYIIAVDPASEVDNFSIIILEIWQEHSRVIYCWTTDRKQFRALVNLGLTQENDFYSFGARKIRQLLQVFPCNHIVMDKQGGGIAVSEALHNKNNLMSNEQPIWPIQNPDKPEDTDYEQGLHILEFINFADAEWTAQANHGLRHDMELKTLLFPRFDQVSLEVASAKDWEKVAKFENDNPGVKAKPYDTFEDCVLEIEELKNEITSITLTRVGSGAQMRDRWDTPEVRTQAGKKGRLRKDRYSALVMANMAARLKRTTVAVLESALMGGLVTEAKGKESDFYLHAPDNIKNALAEFLDSV